MAVAIHQGIESDLIPKIATGFCSGVAQTSGMCGALSGAIMALSMVYGRETDGEDRTVLYKKIQELVEGFEEEFGSRNCSELLDLDLGTEEGQAAYRARNLYPQCEGYVRDAAQLVEELI